MTENLSSYPQGYWATDATLKELVSSNLQKVISANAPMARPITDQEIFYVSEILTTYKKGNLSASSIRYILREGQLDLVKMLFVADATLILSGYFGYRARGHAAVSPDLRPSAVRCYRLVSIETGMPVYRRIARNFWNWQELLFALRRHFEAEADLRYIINT